MTTRKLTILFYFRTDPGTISLGTNETIKTDGKTQNIQKHLIKLNLLAKPEDSPVYKNSNEVQSETDLVDVKMDIMRAQ